MLRQADDALGSRGLLEDHDPRAGDRERSLLGDLPAEARLGVRLLSGHTPELDAEPVDVVAIVATMEGTQPHGVLERSFRQHLGLGALAKPHGIQQHPTIRDAHGNHVPAERDLQPQRDRHRVCAGREPDVRKAFAQWQMVRGGWVIAHAADGRSPAMSKQRGVDGGLARGEGSLAAAGVAEQRMLSPPLVMTVFARSPSPHGLSLNVAGTWTRRPPGAFRPVVSRWGRRVALALDRKSVV